MSGKCIEIVLVRTETVLMKRQRESIRILRFQKSSKRRCRFASQQKLNLYTTQPCEDYHVRFSLVLTFHARLQSPSLPEFC